MKPESSPVGKGPSAGRPRDPRIDAAILQAAAELVVEVGYSNLSLAAVAERAGTTKTALYRRWPSKAELVHEAAFSMPPSAVTMPAGDVAGDLRAMITGARDVFTSPVVRAALPGLIADMAGNAELTARVLGRFEGLFDGLRHWVTDAAARGEVRDGVDPGRLLEVIGGATLFGLMLRPGDDLAGDWVEQVAVIVTRGVLAAP
ncbi:TetR/AcrR family transcriptional regulator [Mycobacterium sp. M1]|uniref:TetR/AcrR family transcriptional regulator n=1 Tax=Mycolicibacter acidiphilus TaxID=2835306 RepID=A0ABS5RHD3_9MYCO|nr:TetR/AcrR family transcriptional regulator [Mycolicibacter acidiphilus]MBS9533681.1 TetR/AcrR family transcriptional regulator [Mycolicibacter acidiphilus]